MKLVDVIVLSVILCLFSTVFAEEISGLRKMDLMIEQLQTETDSLIFISESFYSTCEGRGFSSFTEWEKVCKSLWQLESIDWEYVSYGMADEGQLICGRWSGSDGVKKIYCRRRSPFGV